MLVSVIFEEAVTSSLGRPGGGVTGRSATGIHRQVNLVLGATHGPTLSSTQRGTCGPMGSLCPVLCQIRNAIIWVNETVLTFSCSELHHVLLCHLDSKPQISYFCPRMAVKSVFILGDWKLRIPIVPYYIFLTLLPRHPFLPSLTNMLSMPSRFNTDLGRS